MKLFPFLLITSALTAAAPAQRDLKTLPPVDAASELASFQLAPGLEINLFAQEPLIAKPIQMAWDEKGRLWVATSSIYPHIKPGQTQADKIVVLEDTNRDGVADKSTVFYEGLLVPTGVLPGDGGAYVANSTELLFMRDTDGDGRADQTKVLLSGFGTEDTHHILHSIKRGPDGCLYFGQSVYIHTRIETPYGLRELRGSGWWQYRPETGRLEVYSMGQVNPWGLVWDKWGQTFTTDGAYGEGINYTFPGATFICLPNQLPRILKGLNPGQPKQAGLEIISGRHFPDEWQGQLITCDFRGHRVNRFAVKPEGSGFSSQQLEDVVRSTHGSFRPVDVRMGSDGALYLADWYNPIIQHGEVDFHDERRDREHGRIWRITAKGRGVSPLPDYAKLATDELLELLKAPEDWVRIETKQELKRRKVADLEKLMAAKGVEAIGALQTTRQLSASSPFLSAGGSADYTAYAVRASGQIFLEGGAGNPDLAMRSVTSESARVRLEAVHALRMIKTASAVEQAVKVLDKPMDENLDFALWLTCRELADVWLPALQKGEITFGGDVAQIAFALKAADRPEAAGALVDLVKEGKAGGERATDLLTLVGELGSKEDLVRMVGMATTPGIRTEMQEAARQALITAARQRNVRIDTAAAGALASLAEAPSALTIRLAGVYKMESARPQLEALAAKGGAVTDAAMEALVALRGAGTVDFLTKFSASASSPELKGQALASLFAVDATAASGLIAAYFDSLTEPAAASRIFEACLARKDGPGLLAAALKDRKMNAAVASAGVQKASAAGGDTKGLLEALTVAGGLQPVGVGMSAEELSRMMTEVKEHGDAGRGEQVYRRAALVCQTCHAIGAVGGIVGPDLLSIGASAPVDYIIDSLLEPSKKIKEGYATTVVNTKGGGVFSGFLVREDARELLLRDAAGTTQSIPVADVAGKQSMPVSLMPPGLTASLRRDEFVDLVRFLSELGKEGKYKVQADGVIRRWRLPQLPEGFGQVVNRDGLRALTLEQPGLNWMPAYSEVGGDLPLAAVPQVQLYQTAGLVAQGEIEVTTTGPMVMKLGDAGGIRIWIGEKEITPAPQVPLELPVGKHKVTVVLDPAARQTPLRVEVEAAAGSNARVVPVGGV
jgi:putative heme-binding domain-containing protein